MRWWRRLRPNGPNRAEGGVPTIAEREAELIELIAADATGPEEWVEVAARALAAEQLILERPGEVNLLDYFTEDSPYLEETVRPGEQVMLSGKAHLDGLLATLSSVELLVGPTNGAVTLAVTIDGAPAAARRADGTIVAEVESVGKVEFALSAVLQRSRWRVLDRALERLVG